MSLISDNGSGAVKVFWPADLRIVRVEVTAIVSGVSAQIPDPGS
jgi:hypothetical protein